MFGDYWTERGANFGFFWLGLIPQLLVSWKRWQHAWSTGVSMWRLWAPWGAHYGFHGILAPSVFKRFPLNSVALDDSFGRADVVFHTFPPYPQPYS